MAKNREHRQSSLDDTDEGSVATMPRQPEPQATASTPAQQPTVPPPSSPPSQEQPNVVVAQDPWWEVQAGMLPKILIQAPTPDVAVYWYKHRLRVTRIEPPTVKKLD